MVSLIALFIIAVSYIEGARATIDPSTISTRA